MTKQAHNWPDLQLPQRVLIVGLGKTGLSCARFLARCGVEVAVTDTRKNPPALPVLHETVPDAALFLGGFDARAFAQAQMLVLSPGIPLDTPIIRQARQQGVPVLGDIELFARVVNKPVVGITGSNGKSTVTTLLGIMAEKAGIKVALGGNLGTPALDLLDESVDLYVLELSSFQLETTDNLALAVAVVLNVSEDHMDRYHDLNDYAQAKARIYQHADVAIYNRDDPRVMAMQGGVQRRFFSLSKPRDDQSFGLCRHQDGTEWICRGQQMYFPSTDVRLPGRHNLANALAALAMGEVLGFPLDAMRRALQVFTGLPHRVEYIATIDRVRWYNDSKATNPGAAVAALRGLADGGDGRIVLIAGGQCKDADFSHLAEAVRERVRAVILLGRDKACIRRALGTALSVVDAQDMQDAVHLAAELAEPGDSVLLSPACASFDMFDGFEHRGNVFRQQVQEMSR